MTRDDALALIRDASIAAEPATWADLGCGDGTFTLALAELLPKDSTIHAVDRDRAALRQIPAAHAGTKIVTHVADFTKPAWACTDLDGVMLANSLHYVRHQEAFLQRCAAVMTSPPRFLIVEYDTDQPNQWVPYPVSRGKLEELFSGDGHAIRWLGSRPSIYRRAPLYAAMVMARSLTS